MSHLLLEDILAKSSMAEMLPFDVVTLGFQKSSGRQVFRRRSSQEWTVASTIRSAMKTKWWSWKATLNVLKDMMTVVFWTAELLLNIVPPARMGATRRPEQTSSQMWTCTWCNAVGQGPLQELDLAYQRPKQEAGLQKVLTRYEKRTSVLWRSTCFLVETINWVKHRRGRETKFNLCVALCISLTSSLDC